MTITPETITAFAALITALGSLQVVLYRIKQLEKKQDKHNSLIERMVIVEAGQETQWKRHDELKTRIEKLEG